MTKFITNVNIYLSQMKIKQTYISMKTGIDEKKLSCILKGVQDISVTDMEKIADALGRKIEFFLSDSVIAPNISEFMLDKIGSYAGEPIGKQEEFANKIVLLIEYVDAVLSAKGRFFNISKGDTVI